MNFLRQLFKHSLRVTQSLIVVSLIVAFVVFSLSGAKFPQPLPRISLTPYFISHFSSGLAIYQTEHLQSYYLLSPINDFFISENNSRQPFINPDQASQKQYTTHQDTWWESALLSFFNYWTDVPISFQFSADHRAAYTAIKKDDGVEITATAHLSSPAVAKAYGQTLNFQDADLFFNSQGVQYTAAILTKQSSTNAKFRVPEQTLILHRPDQPGFLAGRTSINQGLWVDFDHQLIEIIQPTLSLPHPIYQLYCSSYELRPLFSQLLLSRRCIVPNPVTHWSQFISIEAFIKNLESTPRTSPVNPLLYS